MKVCKRLPMECFNKCGGKDIPREEVRGEGRGSKHVIAALSVSRTTLIGRERVLLGRSHEYERTVRKVAIVLSYLESEDMSILVRLVF